MVAVAADARGALAVIVSVRAAGWLALVPMLAASCALAHARGDVAPEKVAIPPAGISSSPGALVGFVFRPPSAGPSPAVIMLHGCGGAYARDGRLGARHRMWGRFLSEHGYVVLMLDSFTSRAIDEICTIPYARRPIREAARAGDAYAALQWLRAQRGVDPARVALLGWSHGAGTTLEAMTHKPKGIAGFRAAVAFYPGCTARNRHAARFHPYAPLLVLIGEADDWTPAAPCVALAAAVSARGEPMQIVTYPHTYHDFDNPAIASAHVRHEVPNGTHPGRGVTTAPNAAAREDAKLRVLRFLAAHDSVDRL